MATTRHTCSGRRGGTSSGSNMVSRLRASARGMATHHRPSPCGTLVFRTRKWMMFCWTRYKCWSDTTYQPTVTQISYHLARNVTLALRAFSFFELPATNQFHSSIRNTLVSSVSDWNIVHEDVSFQFDFPEWEKGKFSECINTHIRLLKIVKYNMQEEKLCGHKDS